MKMMLQKGFPLALQSMLFPVANSIIQASVNTMGTDSIAAWGICDKLDMIIWLIADSMGPAMTTYAAQNIGAGKVDRVKRYFYGCRIIYYFCWYYKFLFIFWFRNSGSIIYRGKDVPALIPLVIKYMQMMAPFLSSMQLQKHFPVPAVGLGKH